MKLNKLKKQILQKSLKYIIAGFGLVTALAWNDAIKSLIKYLFPVDKSNLLAKFIYAGAITFILVLVTIYLAKWLDKQKA